MLLASIAEQTSVTIAVIVTVGVVGQWLAGALRVPSVLVLLLAGLLVGPLTGWIDPVEDLGPALFPAVGLGVGLLLFEGGLGLRLDRLVQGRSVVLRLVTVGAFVTWVLAGFAVWLLFDVTRAVAALIGAVLVVSGPTVVIPLLQIARPREPSASILRWEGILVDPIGATLAIVVLDVVITDSDVGDGFRQAVTTLGAGAVIGLVAALLVVVALSFHTVPDRLHNPVVFGVVVGAYAAANTVAPDAGLMAATAMGLLIANQRRAPADRVTAFSEDLGHIVLGSLFVTLGAVVDLDDIVDVLPRSVPLLLALILVVRPLAVWLSTVGTDVRRRDRLYLMMLAPRGIVAASVATVFANTIVEETGEPVPELVPVVFTVVIGTVVVYGILAVPAARWCRVGMPSPRGVGIVSNHTAAVDLADLLAAHDVPVLLITTSRRTQRRARERGLLVYDRPLEDEELELALDGVGVGHALLLTDDANLASHAGAQLRAHLGDASVHDVVHRNDGRAPRARNAFGSATFDDVVAPDVEYVLLEAEEVGEGDVPMFALGDSTATVLEGGAPGSGRVVVARHP
jgi:NhaP-type Na+/H+ or K+/H+ antiporter